VTKYFFSLAFSIFILQQDFFLIARKDSCDKKKDYRGKKRLNCLSLYISRKPFLGISKAFCE